MTNENTIQKYGTNSRGERIFHKMIDTPGQIWENRVPDYLKLSSEEELKPHGWEEHLCQLGFPLGWLSILTSYGLGAMTRADEYVDKIAPGYGHYAFALTMLGLMFGPYYVGGLVGKAIDKRHKK
jgi:hypothetical protein